MFVQFVWALFPIIGILIGVFLGILLVFARWHYGSLEKCGFPVVKPHWFLGSNPNGHKEMVHLVDLERSKTYGHVYGVYDGRMPTVFVSDPIILRRILTKDFEHFACRRTYLETGCPLFLNNFNSPTADLDDSWKSVRSRFSPLFTSSKIKVMSQTVFRVTQQHVQSLRLAHFGKSKFPLEFRNWVSPLILELIGAIYFGVEIKNVRDPQNPLIRLLNQSIEGYFQSMDWTYTLQNSFPIMSWFRRIFRSSSRESFNQILREILKAKGKGIKDHNPDVGLFLMDISNKSQGSLNAGTKRLGRMEEEGIAQTADIVLGTYDAISSTTSILIYYLATYPDLCDRVWSEIQDETLLSKSPSESIGPLPFLTACLLESLRLGPEVFRNDRVCTEDWEDSSSGIRIRKGMYVFIPLWALHRHPQHYPDPDNFEPERWMPGKKETLDPYSYGGFGNGPRACYGERLGLEIMKLIIINFLKEFRVEAREDTVLEAVSGNPLFLTFKPIIVDVLPRESSH